MMRIRGELLKNHPLARYTSWRVGGVADQVFIPADLADLGGFLQSLPATEPLTWLGLGSNVLIRDGGIRGTVILALPCLNLLDVAADFIHAQAGVTCAKLARLAAKQGYTDAAFFAGIPGTVGGALRMNAGAWKGETWAHVESVETIARDGAIRRRYPEEFQVSYRQVLGLAPDEFFVSATFRFPKGDVQAELKRIKRYLKERQSSQPIGTLNCGSVFKNPSDHHAAKLIEQCGLKGLRLGGAVVSQKHANFIINEGQATALDVESLIQRVHDIVLAETGYDLVRECIILGEQQ